VKEIYGGDLSSLAMVKAIYVDVFYPLVTVKATYIDEFYSLVTLEICDAGYLRLVKYNGDCQIPEIEIYDFQDVSSYPIFAVRKEYMMY
jgi:hypothetical protein